MSSPRDVVAAQKHVTIEAPTLIARARIRPPHDVVVPPQARSARVLALQSTIGNRAVVGLMRSAASHRAVAANSAAETVQRRSAGGLAQTKVTKAVAGAAHQLWKGKATKGRPLEDLGPLLMQQVNKQLPYPCKIEYDKGLGSQVASFNHRTWTIRLNLDQITELPPGSKIGQLKQAEAGEFLDSVYHEARHAEQYFRVAQLKTEKQGWLDVALEMEIPHPIALTAAFTPMPADPKTVAEAKTWSEVLQPRYESYKDAVLGLTGSLKELKEYLAPEYVKEKVARQRAFRPSGRSSSRATTAAIESDARAEIIGEIADTITGAEQQAHDLQGAAAQIRRGKKPSKFERTLLAQIATIARACADLQREYQRQRSRKPAQDIPGLRRLAEKAYQPANAAYRGIAIEMDAHEVANKVAQQFNATARAGKK